MADRDVIRAEIPESEFLRFCLRYTDPPLEPQMIHGYTVTVDEEGWLRVQMVVDSPGASPQRHGGHGE